MGCPDCGVGYRIRAEFLRREFQGQIQLAADMPLWQVTTEICHCCWINMNQSLLKSVAWLFALLTTSAVVAEDFRVIPMNQKQLATYYIEASMLGSGNVEFMVDTGAGYTTINDYTLQQLLLADNAVYVGELTGVMADGTRHQLPIYRIKRLVLGTNCVLDNIEAAVFPEKTRMLLGLSALEKAAPFMFSTNPPSLSLSNCGTISG